MKLPHWRNWPVILAAGFAIFSLVALGLALAFRSADQQRLEEGRRANCEAIEVLKAQIRPTLFDLAKTRRILIDLKVDPDSATGQRLLATSRKNNREQRAKLAPAEC